MYPQFIVSMFMLTTASLYVLVAQLHLSTTRALTTSFLGKHVNNPVVAHRRTPPANNPATRAPWLPGDGTAASGGWTAQFKRETGSRRHVNSRERTSHRLLSMASPTAAEKRAAPLVSSSAAKSVNWPLWYVLPIAPYQRRKTLMKEIVPGKVRK